MTPAERAKLEALAAEWLADANARCRAGERAAIRECADQIFEALEALDAEVRDTVPAPPPALVDD